MKIALDKFSLIPQLLEIMVFNFMIEVQVTVMVQGEKVCDPLSKPHYCPGVSTYYLFLVVYNCPVVLGQLYTKQQRNVTAAGTNFLAQMSAKGIN